MTPKIAAVSKKYSRSELLKLRDYSMDSSHIDWSHVDSLLSPQSPVHNVRGIQARITRKLGNYNDTVPGTRTKNLQWLPTHNSIIMDNYHRDASVTNSMITSGNTSIATKTLKRNPKFPRTTDQSLPSIYATNCRSLNINKISELRQLATTDRYDILMLTETWLNTDKEATADIPGYSMFTANRCNRIGGGVALYTTTALCSRVIRKHSSPTLSSLWVLVKQEKATPMIYGVVYHPPNLTNNENMKTIEHLTTTITELSRKHKSAKFLIYGDFNKLDTSLLQHTFNMRQLINFTTRGDAVLDLILSDSSEYCETTITKSAPLALNDHCSVVVSSPKKLPPKYVTASKRMVTPASKSKVGLDLALADFSEVYAAPTVDDKVRAFHGIISTICDKHCPKRNFRVREGDELLHTPLTIKLRRAKDKLHRKGSKAWKVLAKILQSKLKQQRQNFAKRNINQALSGGKRWWKNVNRLIKPANTRSDSTTKHFINEQWMTTPQFLETQNQYYNSLGGSAHIAPPQFSQADAPNLQPVSIGLVKSQLKRIDTSKSCHSDDFPSWISKDFCEDTAPPLTNIINCMLSTHTFPTLWKSAEITPLPKTSSPAVSKDFRPISLLWHCGKVAEYFIARMLKTATKDELTLKQYAYTDGVGCVDALVDALSNWTKHIDQKDNLCIQSAFVDFSKAFDMMNPTILDTKLSRLNVNSSLRQLINSFLTSRSACVANKPTGECSSKLPVSRGVPQGTILGPSLWSIYINDLPDIINDSSPSSDTTIYADDVTTYQPVRKKDVTLKTTAPKSRLMSNSPLQPALSAIHRWSLSNDMSLNTSKTKTMNISPCLDISSDLKLTVNSEFIDQVSEFKLLGVTVDEHLSFSSHVENIFSKARSRLYALLTLKRHGVDEASLTKFYLANIRSILCYAAPAWFSYLSDTNMKRLESIQRQCLRVIYPDIPYDERLVLASIPSLCDYLNNSCQNFVNNVASDTEHRLHKYLPKRQSSVGRHSSRLRDVPIVHNNYKITENSLFSKFTV